MEMKYDMIRNLEITRDQDQKNTPPKNEANALNHGNIDERIKIGDLIKSPGSWIKRLPPKIRGRLKLK